MVDIEFDHKKATENQIVYNEICPPIIEKQEIIDPCERSVHQLLGQYSATEKGNPQIYRATKKAHPTIFKKKFQPMHLEQIFFAVNRIELDSMLRKSIHITHLNKTVLIKIILMNQRSRQNAKNSNNKDFYKLMNNSNFGYDCHKNLDSCQFVPIFDELKEISYLKRYYNYFDPKVSKIVSSDLIKQEIYKKFNDSLMNLSKDDKF